MKLLITGGAGFIGSNFVRYWVKEHPGDSVVVLDALTYAGNLLNLEPVRQKITFIHGNICSQADCDRAIASCDVVVHFAAESHNDRAIADPYIFTKTNVLGTHTLLEAARAARVQRFHHVSTDEVFGHIPLGEHWKFNERTTFSPRSPYAASKAGSDHLVNAYFHTYGLPVTTSNCSNNFGPFQHPEKFIPRAITTLLRGKNVPVYTPGNQVRDWLYVEDHCRAIDLILHRGTVGETYCVGGMTDEVSNIAVVQQILEILKLPESRIDLVADRPGHDQKYAIDWGKVHRELGWQPEHSFAAGLKATVDWYRDNEAWWQPLADEAEKFYGAKTEGVRT
jgi:dTDP-glucose 4,6-dehydratase